MDPFGTAPWFSHLLSIDDLANVDPVRGEFLLQLQDLANQKQAILGQPEISDDVKAQMIGDLKLDHHGTSVALEDLCLTFQVKTRRELKSNLFLGELGTGGKKPTHLLFFYVLIFSSAVFSVKCNIRLWLRGFDS